MIRLILEFDGDEEQFCDAVGKEGEFFLEDSIRWLVDDYSSAKWCTHNKIKIIMDGRDEAQDNDNQ